MKKLLLIGVLLGIFSVGTAKCGGGETDTEIKKDTDTEIKTDTDTEIKKDTDTEQEETLPPPKIGESGNPVGRGSAGQDGYPSSDNVLTDAQYR